MKLFKNDNYSIIVFCLISFIIQPSLHGIVLGSDSATSREDRATFIAVDTDNEMRGFAFFQDGFLLRSSTVTATFNGFYPISSRVNLREGTVFLQEDLIFDSHVNLIKGGRFEGNNHSIEFIKQEDLVELPEKYSNGECGELTLLDSDTLFETVNTTDWSIDDTFVVAGTDDTGDANPELQIYTFDGATLTATSNGALSLGADVNCIRWHPNDYYLAVAHDDIVGEEVKIYYRDLSNGSLTLTSSADVGDNATACAWHPSGDFLVIGNDNNDKEIILYSFTGGIISEVQRINVQNRTINKSAISWSPGGDYVAFGLDNGPSDELLLYYFDGSTLTFTNSINAGKAVKSLDWSPTGTFIAAGLKGSPQRVRLYAHYVDNGVLMEILSARISNSSTIRELHWTNAGDCLLVATSAGVNSAIELYDFNKNTLDFTLFDEQLANQSVFSNRWSKNNAYVSRGTAEMKIDVYAVGEGINGVDFSTTPLVFKDISLIFNSDALFKVPTYFEGNTKINARGAQLSLDFLGQLIVRPGAQLIIEDALVTGLKQDNIRCMTDDGTIILRNCELVLSHNYTFSRGALCFDHDVVISGTNIFTYGVAQTSTIKSLSKLTIDHDVTFYYAPSVADKNLLYMEDETSSLFLDGSTLQISSTGMKLSRGMLLIDNHVTMSTEGENINESLEFDTDITVKVLGDATTDLYGYIKQL